MLTTFFYVAYVLAEGNTDLDIGQEMAAPVPTEPRRMSFPPQPPVDFCRRDRDCGPGRQCSRTGFFCVAAGGGRAGSPCTFESHCRRGLECTGTPPDSIGACVPPLPVLKNNGSPCFDDFECRSGFCSLPSFGFEGTCSPDAPTARNFVRRMGEDSEDSTVEITDEETEMRRMSLRPRRVDRRVEFCRRDRDCGRGRQCSRTGFFCVAAGGGRAGSPCTFESHCLDNLFCSGTPPNNIGSCQRPRNNGRECLEDEQCRSGFCSFPIGGIVAGTCLPDAPTAQNVQTIRP